ncbi:MAG: alpha/beta fold hydrolase [Candidatus Promineifilaceae bacterium]|nr:alpha/beta fold hydrolase [Candidatus Promineifilaceae bacterium]
MERRLTQLFILFLLLVPLLAACRALGTAGGALLLQPAALPGTPAAIEAAVMAEDLREPLAGATAAHTPDADPTVAPTAAEPPTATPTSTATATATATTSPTPTPTPTNTPSPTATPQHPLSIERLRAASYPGSELTLEATLSWGPGHERYIVSYRSEGHKIYALLTIPRGEQPESGWPVIIFNHGYIPPDQYRTTERYESHVETFASHGYIVFRPDYRGHGRSEGEAPGGYGSPAYTVDVLNGLAALKNHPDVDPERIGMWGHSMGGHITLRAMVVSDEIKAGVIWAGVVASYPDLVARWRRPGATPTRDPEMPPHRRWRYELAERYGTPEENPAFWAEISSNSYLPELSGPIQLHHGTADDVVPYEFSETLFEQGIETGAWIQLFLYENDDHNLTIHWTSAMKRSLVFFDTRLKGGQ